MRETERLPRQGVLAATTPFGFAEGTRITLRIHQLDGTIGQGIGRFRCRRRPPRIRFSAPTSPRRLRPVLALASCRPQPGADRRHRRRVPIDGAAAQAAARRAGRRAQGARRSADSSTLVMKERASFERPSYELRTRGSFTAKGERVYAATPSALHPMRDDQPVNRLGLARWLVDAQQSARRARGRQPALAAGVRPRARRDQRGLRHAGRAAVASGTARLAGRRVHRRRAGARRRCSASSSRRPLTGSRPR